MMIRHISRPGIPLAVAGLVLIAGCASGGTKSDTKTASSNGGSPAQAAPGQPAAAAQPDGDGKITAPAGASDDLRKQYAYQNELASCMKAAGFTYQPFVAVVRPQDRDDNDRDYDSAHKIREKYGFGAFARSVYPDDPNVPGARGAQPEDPNNRAYQSLTQDRKDAWNQALMGGTDPGALKKSGKLGAAGCQGQARTKAYGDEAKIQSDSQAQSDQARQSQQNLNGDPTLTRLAQQYASCLRGKGYPISTTSVTEIRHALSFDWFGKAAQASPHGDPNKPPNPNEPPRIDPTVARNMLNQEIQAAVADLDCGRDFRAAYYPKFDKAPGAEGAG
jgi:hypothetical protein